MNGNKAAGNTTDRKWWNRSWHKDILMWVWQGRNMQAYRWHVWGARKYIQNWVSTSLWDAGGSTSLLTHVWTLCHANTTQQALAYNTRHNKAEVTGSWWVSEAQVGTFIYLCTLMVNTVWLKWYRLAEKESRACTRGSEPVAAYLHQSGWDRETYCRIGVVVKPRSNF